VLSTVLSYSVTEVQQYYDTMIQYNTILLYMVVGFFKVNLNTVQYYQYLLMMHGMTVAVKYFYEFNCYFNIFNKFIGQ